MIGFIKKIRASWQEQKAHFIEKHKTIRAFRDIFIWFRYHIERGRGHFSTWIDIAKYYAYALIIIELSPFFKGFKEYTILLVPIVIVFFICYSQLLDLVKMTEAENEQGNKRNYFMLELRDFRKRVMKELKEIKEKDVSK